MAATLAAREAAQKAASEQKEKSDKEMHETSIAQEAAHNALASYAGNQASNHLGPSTFTYQPTQPTGFNANTGAIADSPMQAQMHQGYPGACHPPCQFFNNSLKLLMCMCVFFAIFRLLYSLHLK